ncbi:DUF4145 domain-containing protein [Streptacidiphilus monticola]
MLTQAGLKARFLATEIQEWTPSAVRWPPFEDVPEAIAAAASEAHACLSINAHRGAVALARAVVEAIAKDKGITRGNLQKKIDDLAAQGFIRGATKETAHEIRYGGNEVAHSDPTAEALSADDAQEILDLMDEILQEVYQGPAKTARLKERRQERERSAGGEGP